MKNKGNIKIVTSGEGKLIIDNVIFDFIVQKTNQPHTYPIRFGLPIYQYQDTPEKFTLIFDNSDMTEIEIGGLCNIASQNIPVDATIAECVASQKYIIFFKNVHCNVVRDVSKNFPEIVFYWTRHSFVEYRMP